MQQYFWLAVAGALGSLARYSLSYRIQTYAGLDFPLGTLFVNVVGCFLFGLIWSLCEERMLITPGTRVILLSGFMGAFTTFSTFGFETAQMLRSGQWNTLVQNIVLQVVLGLLAVLVGLSLGRKV